MRPNGLGISGGAPLDRYGLRAASDVQKSHDLVGAERRPLYARVGRRPGCLLIDELPKLLQSVYHLRLPIVTESRLVSPLHIP